MSTRKKKTTEEKVLEMLITDQWVASYIQTFFKDRGLTEEDYVWVPKLARFIGELQLTPKLPEVIDFIGKKPFSFSRFFGLIEDKIRPLVASRIEISYSATNKIKIF